MGASWRPYETPKEEGLRAYTRHFLCGGNLVETVCVEKASHIDAATGVF